MAAAMVAVAVAAAMAIAMAVAVEAAASVASLPSDGWAAACSGASPVRHAKCEG